ncbi:SCP2 sterol-binding domain-containing protein [Salipaludibacillus aurantiacus]|uniref:SCP2 sterol-binding domain-containing protein n=1 Tax=Salipaludibacillus aurantiacus TaxID=1601833 RepID=UPI000B881455|nr:SCP2 sterol-binding domain-containing protein [Salipaludibacillus aurantiacus]
MAGTLLASVINDMKQTDRIRKLVKKYEITLLISCGSENWFIAFIGIDTGIVRGNGAAPDVIIKGDEDSLKMLFQGEDFLLTMRRRGELEAKGSLKYLLWLESLFYLCHTTPCRKSYPKSIIS